MQILQEIITLLSGVWILLYNLNLEQIFIKSRRISMWTFYFQWTGLLFTLFILFSHYLASRETLHGSFSIRKITWKKYWCIWEYHVIHTCVPCIFLPLLLFFQNGGREKSMLFVFSEVRHLYILCSTIMNCKFVSLVSYTRCAITVVITVLNPSY